jgi:hypothetical protein
MIKPNLTPQRRSLLENAEKADGDVIRNINYPGWRANGIDFAERCGENCLLLGWIAPVKEISSSRNNTVEKNNGYLYRITEAGKNALKGIKVNDI